MSLGVWGTNVMLDSQPVRGVVQPFGQTVRHCAECFVQGIDLVLRILFGVCPVRLVEVVEVLVELVEGRAAV